MPIDAATGHERRHDRPRGDDKPGGRDAPSIEMMSRRREEPCLELSHSAGRARLIARRTSNLSPGWQVGLVLDGSGLSVESSRARPRLMRFTMRAGRACGIDLRKAGTPCTACARP